MCEKLRVKVQKMILNFTQNCVSNTKILQGAKRVPNLGSDTNIVFSLEGNKI